MLDRLNVAMTTKPTPETAAVKPVPEWAALFTLYYATNGESWTISDHWLSDAPISTWYGVGVDGERGVVSPALGDNQLTGRMPPE